MNKKLTAILVLLLISFTLFALSRLATAAPVFSDNFSTGNFANWSQAYVSSGSSQTVSDGVAHFIVPTPTSGNETYSYLGKDGFASTVNSTITAAENVFVNEVPNGCPQGNDAIFFLYICDSTDSSGNSGNFGVGIDGSDAWSLWIGGNPVYTYVFQTAGSAPASNTWYHIILMINNSAETVTLTVDGVVVIDCGQQQFIDKTHSISLMSGMGEDWWSQGSGQQEVDIANVELDISDATAVAASNPTSPPPTQSSEPTQNLAPAPTQTITTPTPSPIATATPSPIPSPTSTTIQASRRAFLWVEALWVILPVVTLAVVCVAAVIGLRKR